MSKRTVSFIRAEGSTKLYPELLACRGCGTVIDTSGLAP